MGIRRKLATMVAPLALLALAAAADANAVAAGELRATVRNVKPNQGKVMVALFDSAGAQASNKPRAGYFAVAAGAQVVVVFPDLPPGRYGLMAFQDLDNNSELTTGLLGVPSEPYGFSRAAHGSFGPPSFDDYAVPVGATGVATTDIPLAD